MRPPGSQYQSTPSSPTRIMLGSTWSPKLRTTGSVATPLRSIICSVRCRLQHEAIGVEGEGEGVMTCFQHFEAGMAGQWWGPLCWSSCRGLCRLRPRDVCNAYGRGVHSSVLQARCLAKCSGLKRSGGGVDSALLSTKENRIHTSLQRFAPKPLALRRHFFPSLVTMPTPPPRTTHTHPYAVRPAAHAPLLGTHRRDADHLTRLILIQAQPPLARHHHQRLGREVGLALFS